MKKTTLPEMGEMSSLEESFTILISPKMLTKRNKIAKAPLFFAFLLQLTFFIAPSLSLKVDGFSSHVVLEGSKAILRCNTSAWSEDATVIIWFRGLSGSAIYSYDRRTSLEKMHVKGESSPPPPPVPQLPSSSLSSSSSSSFSGEAHDHKRLDERPEDHVFPDRERLFVDRSSPIPSLVIDPVKETDGGDYRCRVDARSSRTKSYLVTLHVIVPPKELSLVDPNGHRVGRVAGPYDEGSDLIIFCRAFGKPAPVLKWWASDGNVLQENYVTSTNGVSQSELRLTNLNRSNLMNELICRASNTNLTQEVSISTFIDLNLKPLQVKLIPPRTSIIAGKRIEFKCQSIGSRPRPRISWFKSTSKLTDVLESHSADSNVTISTVTFIPEISDNGKHLSCRADNPTIPASALEEGIRLHVNYVPQLNLVLGANINPNSIIEGSDVYTECHIRSNPAVYEVTWLFEGEPLFTDRSKGIIIANQTLVLQRIKKSSRGHYQCLGRNEIGVGKSNPLFLRVQFPPFCIQDQSLDYTIALNEQTDVTCEVESDPPDVTFKWFYNNSSETTEIKNFVSEGTHSVLKYTPQSRYSYGTLFCIAENSVAVQSKPCIFNVIPAGPPQPLRSCSISNHSLTSLLVDCVSGDDGGLKQQFHIEVYHSSNHPNDSPSSSSAGHHGSSSLSKSSSSVRMSSSSLTPTLVFNGSSSERATFVIENLTPGSEYNLVIYASNERGKSNPLYLNALTLGPPEKRTSSGVVGSVSGGSGSSYFPVWMYISLTSALVVLFVLGLTVFLRRTRSKQGIQSNVSIRIDELEDKEKRGGKSVDPVEMAANEETILGINNFSTVVATDLMVSTSTCPSSTSEMTEGGSSSVWTERAEFPKYNLSNMTSVGEEAVTRRMVTWAFDQHPVIDMTSSRMIPQVMTTSWQINTSPLSYSPNMIPSRTHTLCPASHFTHCDPDSRVNIRTVEEMQAPSTLPPAHYHRWGDV